MQAGRGDHSRAAGLSSVLTSDADIGTLGGAFPAVVGRLNLCISGGELPVFSQSISAYRVHAGYIEHWTVYY